MVRVRWQRSRAAWVLAGAALAPPGGRAGAQSAELRARTSEALEWMPPLVLQETDDALAARPDLHVDPAGGFMVTDPQAAQVRFYDSEGALREYFGRKGDGPGEFRDVQGVARFPDGRLCVGDQDGRLSIWTETGELVDDVRTGTFAVMDVAALDDHTVAVITHPNAPSFDSLLVPMIHVFDVDRRQIEGGFMELPLNADNAMAALTVAGDVVAGTGDRIGVTWTTFDSLWVADLRRRTVVRAVQLESPLLRANAPPVDRRRDPQGFGAWLRASTFPGRAYPAPEGGWLVVLHRLPQAGGVVHDLLRVDEDGREIWQLEDVPHLAAVDASAGVLYFGDPTGLAPGTFLRAHLRD